VVAAAAAGGARPAAASFAAAGRAGGISAEVRAAVAALPRRQREVVALRLLADYSGEQTARLLGISTGAVSAHLHRALARLRATLPEPEPEPAELKETP